MIHGISRNSGDIIQGVPRNTEKIILHDVSWAHICPFRHPRCTLYCYEDRALSSGCVTLTGRHGNLNTRSILCDEVHPGYMADTFYVQPRINDGNIKVKTKHVSKSLNIRAQLA